MTNNAISTSGADLRFTIHQPPFNADLINYGLIRAFNNISFHDLEKSFNYRFKRQTTAKELHYWYHEMEKAAKGAYVQHEWEELTRPVCYWPKEVLQPYEMDKLFTLATHLHGHEVLRAPRRRGLRRE